MAGTEIQLYDNAVIEFAITDLTNTTINAMNLMTMDTSLETAPGLKKIFHKYTYANTVEKLGKGEKNSGYGSVKMEKVEYTVDRFQQAFQYYDDDVYQDPKVLDVMTRGAGQVMANDIKAKYFGELDKISTEVSLTSIDEFNYDAVIDAIAEMGDVEKDTEGLFLIMGADGRAVVRKDEQFLATRNGEQLHSGEFGQIAGIPVLFSNLVPEGTIYLTNKDAVKFFVKRNGAVEQDRDIETKQNTVVYTRWGNIVLVDDTRCVKFTTGA